MRDRRRAEAGPLSARVVEARALGKRYGRVTALEGLDLSIEAGTIFGLLGANGAGKSTTFGILCGWLRASAGEARVLGTDSRRLHTLRGRVSALPQDADFPAQIAVRAQLAHYARLGGLRGAAAQGAAERSLERLGLGALGTRRGVELSHGQRKRVGLAQALLGSPEVVFLDEPTAGLDPSARRLVKDLIGELGREATVVVSSHDLAEIEEMCTHGAILDRGRCVASGSIGELRRQGTLVTIEVGPGATVPWETLHAHFGPDAARPTAAGEVHLELADGDVAAGIATALQILLDAKTPILGVERGTSLEATFLELTRSTPPDDGR